MRIHHPVAVHNTCQVAKLALPTRTTRVVGLSLQVSANLRARMQKAEADLQVAHSKQQHIQLQLDSAHAERSALHQELESAMQGSSQTKSALKAEQLQRLQAQANCAQLQDELHSSVHSHEALLQTVQELQVALAIVKQQTSPCHTSHTLRANNHDSTQRHTPRHSQHRPESTSYGSASEVSPSGGVVAALQQQVLELRAISAHLDQCHQQAERQGLLLTQGRTSGSVQGGECLQQGCIDRTRMSQSQPFRHSCSEHHSHLSQHSVLSPSVCQSPASCSHVHESIRAHHGMQHSTDDQCWCGRPKRGVTSVLSMKGVLSVLGVLCWTCTWTMAYGGLTCVHAS